MTLKEIQDLIKHPRKYRVLIIILLVLFVGYAFMKGYVEKIGEQAAIPKRVESSIAGSKNGSATQAITASNNSQGAAINGNNNTLNQSKTENYFSIPKPDINAIYLGERYAYEFDYYLGSSLDVRNNS